MKIINLKAMEVLDSRGNPTVEVKIFSDKFEASAIVPSGASTGTHEALELRDGEKRYGGKGVLKAVTNVNTIIKTALKNKEFAKQEELDNTLIALDGTKNKSQLGANAILGTSMAYARLNALEQNIPLYKVLGKETTLPIPFMNIINGGRHASNNLQIQEFMIAPMAKTYNESLRIGVETYHSLKKAIEQKYGKSSTNVGDEGGFAPNINNTEDAVRIIIDTIEKQGYGKEIKIAMDAAASEFYSEKGYYIDGAYLTSQKLMEKYETLVKNYPFVSLEDPFSEDDFEGFANLTKSVGKKVQIVGDDLLVTNSERIKLALEKKACNALLLKVNQIGTVTEAIKAANLSMQNSWNVMVSHRSGETEDPFIADLAVGLGSGQIKSGAPCRGERLAKYNRLLRIEEELGVKAKYLPKIK